MAAWRVAPISTYTLSKIKTHSDLQIRSERASSYSDAVQDAKTSARQIEQFAAMLTADSGFDLDAILVAKVDGVLFLVDGHHRMHAYRRACRPAIPARVLETTMAGAASVALVVNFDQQKRQPTRGQSAEAAWQWMARTTGQGRMPLPHPHSYRSVAARFGIGKSSVERMANRMDTTRERVDAGDFPSEWMHATFRWPHWKDCCSNHWKDQPAMDQDVKEQRQIAACVKKLAALCAQYSPDVYRKACAAFDADEAEVAGDDSTDT